ncbi:uncharacterized protein TRIADDRAFT_58113 [Trichoplax adhaerens]|uniref:DUF676 domain-containing protein n=1 Tax=Trichoplax adhaerens TaxID=10228 RepID=B3S2Q8_TRIAD|nr:hypothetical protein TRIADDRAFT_58113 [Trichoplax adhaerens]EDV23463.1 hypothetical protein TRIADDRAFT_58113 [Trichoplax adhaerens]|eukprot:XP_002114373.1 hypothetical protein TRIADDRAFT_58113 [Trichoplax adhaerens]
MNKMEGNPITQSLNLYYNLRVVLKPLSRFQCHIDVKQLHGGLTDNDQTDHQIACPSIAVNRHQHGNELEYGAISKTFHIEYQKEKIELHDGFQFSMDILLPNDKSMEWIRTTSFSLQLSLCYYEKDDKPTSWSDLTSIVSYNLKLQLSSCGQLHYARPIVFDYLHLSAVEMVIHSMLVGIYQPTITNKVIKYGLFNKRSTSITITEDCNNQHLNLQHVFFPYKTSHPASKKDLDKAIHIYKYWYCHLVKCTNQINSWIQDLYKTLHSNRQQTLSTSTDVGDEKQSHGLTDEEVKQIQAFNIETISEQLSDNIKILNDKLSQLWTSLLEVVTNSPILQSILLEKHHKQRVCRILETLFTTKSRRDLLGCYHASKDESKSRILRYIYSTSYLKTLPNLPVHCRENDGEYDNIPTLFEDIVCNGFERTNASNNELESSNSVNGHSNHINESQSAPDRYKQNGSASSSQSEHSLNTDSYALCQPLIRKAIYNSMQPRPGTVDIHLSAEEKDMISVLDRIGRTDGTSLSPTKASQRIISEVANSDQDDFDLHPDNQSPTASTVSTSSSAVKLSTSDRGYRNDSTSSKPHTLSNTSMDDVALVFDDSIDVFDSNEKLLNATEPEVGSVNKFESAPFFAFDPNSANSGGTHLVICVHGLEGHKTDLRNFRIYLECALPDHNFVFLMSSVNEDNTFDSMEVMTENLIAEISSFIKREYIEPTRISFIGHSLGTLLVRSALGHSHMAQYLDKLYTFVSLSGPHLGTLYHPSTIVNTGMWFMQRWKKSTSLLQLSLSDHSDPRKTFLYQLNKSAGLTHFKNILLVSSEQDRYVSYHSARIEHCKLSIKDNSDQGAVYTEMLESLLEPLKKSNTNVIRYNIFHNCESSLNSFIGRAAHIAMLDSELFTERFLFGYALKYFR